MAERYPMTVQQRQLLQEDLEAVRSKVDDIVSLVRASFGETSEATVRADETSAALQRLEWAIKRELQAAGPSS